MDTLVRMKADEISNSMVDFIKSSFKGKKIAVHIYEDEMDDTDFLLSNEKTRKRLLESIDDAKNNRNLTEISLTDIENILNEPE